MKQEVLLHTLIFLSENFRYTIKNDFNKVLSRNESSTNIAYFNLLHKHY